MPKCEADHILLDQVRSFMRENGLTASGAAAKLGVERTTFWRFCCSGKARADTKNLYREALKECNKNKGVSVADFVAVKSRLAPKVSLADHELQMIRKACEGVLALLDVYELER